jgi:hypothetical protein
MLDNCRIAMPFIRFGVQWFSLIITPFQGNLAREASTC